MLQLVVVLAYASVVLWLAAHLIRDCIQTLTHSLGELTKELARIHGALSVAPPRGVTAIVEPRSPAPLGATVIGEPNSPTPERKPERPARELDLRYSPAPAAALAHRVEELSARAGERAASVPGEPRVAVAPRSETDLVREVYTAWLLEEEPRLPRGMEARSLRLVSKIRPGPFSEPVLQFEDVEGLGELMRVSSAGGSTAMVLPHPRIRERPDIWRQLFPDWDDEHLGDRSRLTGLQPIQMKKKNDLWTKVAE